MSVQKCILQFGRKAYPAGVIPTCGNPVVPGGLTCKDCKPEDPRYAMRFYGSIFKILTPDVRHSVGSFPWKTCGTPADDAISVTTLEAAAIETMERVETTHTKWFWKADKIVTKMLWSTGSYVHELTAEQLQELRQKRDELAPLCATNPRCVKDCVIRCNCHSWYGIVLTADGTKVNTELNPVPEQPYTMCWDCWHLCGRNQREVGNPWFIDTRPGYIPRWPLPSSTCKNCLDKPQRRRVWHWLDGYWMC